MIRQRSVLMMLGWFGAFFVAKYLSEDPSFMINYPNLVQPLNVLSGLLLVGLIIYYICWLVAARIDMNERGAQIPPSWLLIIPFANIYYLVRFVQGFTHHITYNPGIATVGYFLLLAIFPFLGCH